MDKSSSSLSQGLPAYICKNPLCLTPISIDSLPDHLKKHKDFNTEAIIENFENFIQSIKGELKLHKQEIEKNIIKRDNSTEINDYLSKITRVKEDILKSIAHSFDLYIETGQKAYDKLQGNINELCEQNAYEIDQIETEFDNLKYESEEIKKFVSKLDKLGPKISTFKNHLKEYTSVLKSNFAKFSAESFTESV
jgi:DNA repair exonuclease SbcCD ATPase subunit